MRQLLLLTALLLPLPGCLPAAMPLTPGGETRPLTIVGLVAPTDARVGEAVPLTVTARLYDACSRVERLEAQMDGAARTVTVQGLAAPGTGPCAAGVREETVALTFTPKAAGTYRLEVPHGVARERLERTIRVLD